jgi:hypothetical protein
LVTGKSPSDELVEEIRANRDAILVMLQTGKTLIMSYAMASLMCATNTLTRVHASVDRMDRYLDLSGRVIDAQDVIEIDRLCLGIEAIARDSFRRDAQMSMF